MEGVFFDRMVGPLVLNLQQPEHQSASKEQGRVLRRMLNRLHPSLGIQRSGTLLHHRTELSEPVLDVLIGDVAERAEELQTLRSDNRNRTP
eukprot:755100-Hanusia_phi.AAC.9